MHQRPEYVKDVRFIKPPFDYGEDKPAPPAGMNAKMPEWVNEACVGLVMTLIQSERGYYLVLAYELMRELVIQQPGERSVEASEWIDDNVWWGGPLCIAEDRLEVLQEALKETA